MDNSTIETIRHEALNAITQTSSDSQLRELSIKYLGRKGVITGFLRNISDIPSDERPLAGQRANELKKEISAAIDGKREQLLKGFSDGMDSDRIDVSLPGVPCQRGRLHPTTQIIHEICSIFSRMGFSIVEGPEIETDYYNFEALNFPPYHPARDMQDTFFVSAKTVLRTHTSSTQPRVMERRKPPLRIIAPGKTYRCDFDVTHTPMFHQVEGFVVDTKVSFSDLKGTLISFIHRIFDGETVVRFRPSFFPFTEPSAEVDIRCVICRGKGCRVCSGSGWLEIMGAGMIHPAVFESAQYDSETVSGFAFGMGVERVAMLKYQIDDIRKFFENDIRFLKQF